MNKKVIAILGDHATGKDTLGNNLLNKHPDKMDVFNISKSLKMVIKNILGIDDKSLEKIKREGSDIVISTHIDKIINMRNLLISTGKVMVDTFGKDVFIDACIKDIKASKRDYILITDLRFIHEYKRLKEEFEDMIIININKYHIEDDYDILDIPFDKSFEFDINYQHVLKIQDYIEGLINE